MSIADIIVLLIVALILILIIRFMVKNVKAGRGLDGGCGGDCSKCGGCH